MRRFLPLPGVVAGSVFPALLLAGLGFAVFPESVTESMALANHPEVAYTKLVVFGLAVLYAGYALYAGVRDEQTASRWRALHPVDRAPFLASLKPSSALRPVLDVLSGTSQVPAHVRRVAVDAELAELEKQVSDRLTTPAFLGVALLGLGLLGACLSCLTHWSLFDSEGAQRPEPMAAWGTALVFGMCGLLGSMVVGLLVLIAHQQGRQFVARVRQTVRDSDIYCGWEGQGAGAPQADADLLWAESRRWSELFNDMRAHNESMVTLMLQLQEQSREVLHAATDLNAAMRERSRADTLMANALMEATAALSRTGELNHAVHVGRHAVAPRSTQLARGRDRTRRT